MRNRDAQQRGDWQMEPDEGAGLTFTFWKSGISSRRISHKCMDAGEAVVFDLADALTESTLRRRFSNGERSNERCFFGLAPFG